MISKKKIYEYENFNIQTFSAISKLFKNKTRLEFQYFSLGNKLRKLGNFLVRLLKIDWNEGLWGNWNLLHSWFWDGGSEKCQDERSYKRACPKITI